MIDMGKGSKRIAGAAAVVALALILAALLALGRDTYAVEHRVKAAVSSGATELDFVSATPFEWDRMYVFGCYTPRSEVERALRFEWPGFRRTSIERSDSVCLVAFVRNSEVIYWYEQPRTIELGGLANGKGYSPSKANFRVVRTDDQVALTPIAANENL
jgi:hypothetical protein